MVVTLLIIPSVINSTICLSAETGMSKECNHTDTSETSSSSDLECIGCGCSNPIVSSCHFKETPYSNGGGSSYILSKAYS